MSVSLIKLTDHADSRAKEVFFRDLDLDSYERSSGDVEAPTGWFGLYEVAQSDRDEYEEAPEVADGLYLVVIDSNGLIWAYQGLNEDHTRRAYEAREAEYGIWLGEDEAPSVGFQP